MRAGRAAGAGAPWEPPSPLGRGGASSKVVTYRVNKYRTALCVFPGSKNCSNFAGARGASLPRPRDRQPRHTTTAAETAAAAKQARSHGRPQLAHGIRAPRAPSTHPSCIASTTAGDELGVQGRAHKVATEGSNGAEAVRVRSARSVRVATRPTGLSRSSATARNVHGHRTRDLVS